MIGSFNVSELLKEAESKEDTLLEDNKMGSNPMFSLIISMSFPAVLSMLIQALYNVVDSIFVSRIGENALTAVSLSFPIQNTMIGVGVGTAIGINSLISRSLGAKRQDVADSAASHSIFLGAICGFIFLLFGIFGTKMFFGMFTDDPEIISMGVSYLSTVCFFSIGLFVQINIEKTIQSTGNMIYPMIIQIIGAVINLIFDPIFIFGLFGLPAMGVFGAALATVLGQLIAMFVGIYILVKKSHGIKIKIKGFRPDLHIIRNIYKVGIPSMIMQTIGSFVVVTINNILIGFSTTAVSILGIYFKLQSFIYMPVFGIMQGIMPIFGYNFGAKNRDRLASCIKISLLLVFGLTSIGVLAFQVFNRQLLMAFNASEDMLEIGIPALRIISLSFISAGFGITISTFFQALGHGFKSLILSSVRQVFIIIPFCLIMPKYFGIVSVWWSYPISEFFGLILGVIILISVYKKEISSLL
ncbi:MAG: MATE family efflux transporter [Oscillospiraceae bacterium]